MRHPARSLSRQLSQFLAGGDSISIQRNSLSPRALRRSAMSSVEHSSGINGRALLKNAFADDVIAGLSMTPKSIPSKYFYDARGSRLFQQIMELPEYYLTRCELEILRTHGRQIAA